MRDPLVTLIAGSILAALLLPTSPAQANDLVAKIENTGYSLVFHPVVEAAQLTLTVGGPCNFHYEQVLKKGQPVFKLGEETIDGAYTYTLVATPHVDPEVFEILREARQSGDETEVNRLCRAGKLPRRAASQIGGFTVLKQKIVIDTTPEGQRRSDRDPGP